VQVALADRRPVPGKMGLRPMRLKDYWRGVPRRFRDVDRYAVERVISLQLETRKPDEVIKVRDRANGVLAWTSDARRQGS
jgi:hypothetical protein